MSEPKFEHGLTEAVMDIVNDLESSRMVVDGTNRIGTIKLKDGRLAQIHVTVTTEEEEFLKEWK